MGKNELKEYKLKDEEVRLIELIVSRELDRNDRRTNIDLIHESHGYPIGTAEEKNLAGIRYQNITKNPSRDGLFQKYLAEVRKESLSNKVLSFNDRAIMLSEVAKDNIDDRFEGDTKLGMQAINELNKMFKDIDSEQINITFVENQTNNTQQNLTINTSNEVLKLLQAKHNEVIEDDSESV